MSFFYVFCCLGEVKNSTPSAFGAKGVAVIVAAHHTLHISKVIPSLNSAKREKVFLTRLLLRSFRKEEGLEEGIS